MIIIIIRYQNFDLRYLNLVEHWPNSNITLNLTWPISSLTLPTPNLEFENEVASVKKDPAFKVNWWTDRVIEYYWQSSSSISPQFLFILSPSFPFSPMEISFIPFYLLLGEKMKCKLVWRSYGHSTPFFQWCPYRQLG